jgi:hypothetical protein
VIAARSEHDDPGEEERQRQETPWSHWILLYIGLRYRLDDGVCRAEEDRRREATPSYEYASLSSDEAYHDGVVKRTSLNLRLDLVDEARQVLGTKGTTDTIHRALEEVVRRERLRELAGERFDDLSDAALEELRRTRTW